MADIKPKATEVQEQSSKRKSTSQVYVTVGQLHHECLNSQGLKKQLEGSGYLQQTRGSHFTWMREAEHCSISSQHLLLRS
jgi:hypothetical protein